MTTNSKNSIGSSTTDPPDHPMRRLFQGGWARRAGGYADRAQAQRWLPRTDETSCLLSSCQ